MKIASKIPSKSFIIKAAAVTLLTMWVVFKFQPLQKAITGLNDN